MQSSGELLGSAVLRKFQKELVDIKKGAILLSAPTGSGKTVALLTDSERRAALGLYPNNELLCSQVAGLDKFVRNYLNMLPRKSSLTELCRHFEGSDFEDLPLNIYDAHEPVDLFGEKIRRVHIAGFSGKVVRRLDEIGKLNVLDSVVSSIQEGHSKRDSYAIVLATPDTFFLLTLYLYQDFRVLGRLLSLLKAGSTHKLEKLNKELMRIAKRDRLTKIAKVISPIKESTLFIDEYHLYDFYELASLKVLVHILKNIHDWDGRIVFSSATPRREFVEDIVKETGFSENELQEVNALEQVKESGADHELIRGPMKLVFYGVNTNERSRIAKLYRSSELAYELLEVDEFKEFIKLHRRDGVRGIAILEKVSHAELFVEKLNYVYGVNPVCLYSMPRSDICLTQEDNEHYLIVGTGARIGQGVEYEGVTFGVIARITAPDFLQSISRIGRRYPGVSTVLIPLDNEIVESRKGMLGLKGNTSYKKLAEYVEKAEPFLKAVPKEYEGIYEDLVKAREPVLKALGHILHYRLSGTHSRGTESQLKDLDLVIIAPPDELYRFLLFRAAGPNITYARDINGKLECQENDLGTIVRNYEIATPKGEELCENNMVLNRRPALLVKSIKPGGSGKVDIVVKCEKGDELVQFVKEYGGRLVIEWSFLEDIFRCKCVLRERGTSDQELKDLMRELKGQLFLIPNPWALGDYFANYIYRTGRGLKVKIGNTAVSLVFI